MAKFDVKRYGDNLIDYTTLKANKAISSVEMALITSIDRLAAKVYDIQNVNKYWTNRTWNLLSSFFAVVLYNRKILGVQTAGYDFAENTTRKSVEKNSGKKQAGLRQGQNPVFGSRFTNRGMTEWRSDDKEHYPFYGGFAYANKAMQTVIGRTRKMGYVVIIGFGMPYATYNWPKAHLVKKGGKQWWTIPMYMRTKGLLNEALRNFEAEIHSKVKGVTIKVSREYYRTTNTTR